MATVIAGGVLEIVTARLRHDTTHELPSLAEPLAHWMLSYRAPTEANATPLTTSRPSDSVLRPAAARADSAPPRLDVAAERGGPPLWRDESARPIALPDARARILKAATEIVGARGYSALSVNEIVRSARVSHRTFRKHFATKDDAFVAAYRDSAKDTFEYALKAFAAETNWKMAVRAGLTAELRFLAMHPEVARLGFIEVYGVGAKALELRESELQLWKAALEPGYQESRAGPLPHKIVSEAVAGGIHQLMREGTLYQPEQLLDLVPDVTYAALAPFIGADAATLAADREA
jgi:AcrR family transcriptional regulator